MHVPNNVTNNAFTPCAEMQDHIDGLNEYLNKLYTSPLGNDDEDDTTSPLNCNYNSPEEFYQAKFNSSKSFSVFHYNIHSINRHIDSLQTLMLSKNLPIMVLEGK